MSNYKYITDLDLISCEESNMTLYKTVMKKTIRALVKFLKHLLIKNTKHYIQATLINNQNAKNTT